HRAFFLDDEEKDRAVALMRRVEAGVKASMSYCINRTVSISSDPFDPRAFFLDDEEKDRAVALMRRVEAGVKASMSYCINRTVSISSDPFDPSKEEW
ncbi:MAG: hypothetical protein K6G91_13950, partial [Kiritimatiellae bacterium]|nr:hypothetical protein [Kiritimatiellia bacterium]